MKSLSKFSSPYNKDYQNSLHYHNFQGFIQFRILIETFHTTINFTLNICDRVPSEATKCEVFSSATCLSLSKDVAGQNSP